MEEITKYKGRVWQRRKPDRRRCYTVVLPEIIYQYLKKQSKNSAEWSPHKIYLYPNRRLWFAPGKQKIDIIFEGEEADDLHALLKLIGSPTGKPR
jgi:hypothetical protein